MKQHSCPTCKEGKVPDALTAGQTVRQLRKKLKVRARHVADSVGLSHSFMSELEAGKKAWSYPLLRMVVRTIRQLARK